MSLHTIYPTLLARLKQAKPYVYAALWMLPFYALCLYIYIRLCKEAIGGLGQLLSGSC